jgi:hypothetical protein
MVYLMSVPKETFYVSGEQYLAEDIIDEFFLNTEEYILEFCRDYLPRDFEVEVGEVSYPKREAKDKLISLVLNDERKRILAGVLCSQTGFGNWYYKYFRDLSFLEKNYLITSNLASLNSVSYPTQIPNAPSDSQNK